MSSESLQFLGTLATGALALLGIWISVRQSGKKAKTDAAQNLMDQVQEERDELKKDIAALKLEVAKMQTDMRAAYSRELLLSDYLQSLRNHIRMGLGPPPPDWPEELRNG